MFFERTAHKIVLSCNTNVPCDWSGHFLYQRIHVFPQERRVDRLPRNHCNFDKLCKLVEFVPKAYDRSLHSDLRLQRLQFGECGDTSPSKASVCSISRGQRTTVHRLPAHLRVRQAKGCLQVSGWFRLFFSQETRVGRLTPKVRCTPRILERS